MMHGLETLIKEQPFFQGMEERHIQLIAGCSMNVRFDAGHAIFHEGDPADHFYLIREGQVAVQFAIPHKSRITVQTVSENEVLGWSWLLAPYRWHFNAVVQKPTRALAFDGKCLRSKCDEDHDFGYAVYKRFMQIVTERLKGTLLQVLDMYDTRV